MVYTRVVGYSREAYIGRHILGRERGMRRIYLRVMGEREACGA